MEDYRKIEYNEFSRIWSANRETHLVPLNINQKSIIKKYIDIKNVKSWQYAGGVSFKCSDGNFVIYQIPDEWFLIFSDSSDDELYYLCDQWYGLIKCIEDNFISEI